jgi:hypothetical protein
MATTTNYGWTTPDDTDLVKDGAAAIRTLGSSIDTTTKNLNPETTTGDIAYRSATANTNTRLAIGSSGQVLTVAGGVPSWATPTTGDIEGVTAGTGISGGGTSGTVTVTNSMATAIDAKGDLIAGTGADTFARLAVGTNGHTLVADSAEATGLKWAAPAGGGKVLQVVAATNNTTSSSSSDVFADTGLTATITPSLATSKVLVLVTQSGLQKNTGDTQTSLSLKLVRTSTDLAVFGDSLGYQNTNTRIMLASASINFLDAPNTTSATTYKTRFSSNNNSASVQVQANGAVSSIILIEIGA